MGSVFVVVADILCEKTLQVPFVERNHVIEQVAAATPNPALRHSILPRTLVRGLKNADFHRVDGNWHLESVILIAIENQKAGNGLEWEGMP